MEHYSNQRREFVMSFLNRKVTEVLSSLSIQPIAASVMFTAAILLLMLPGPNQIFTKKFFRRVALVLMSAVYIAILIFSLLVTAIQANQLFCTMVNGRFDIISDLETKWQRLFGIYLLLMVGLFNIICACILKYFATRMWNFTTGLFKKHVLVKKRPKVQQYAKTIEWLQSDMDEMLNGKRMLEPKVTRHGTTY